MPTGLCELGESLHLPELQVPLCEMVTSMCSHGHWSSPQQVEAVDQTVSVFCLPTALPAVGQLDSWV